MSKPKNVHNKNEREEAQRLAEELASELPRGFSWSDAFRLGSSKSSNSNVVDRAAYLVKRACDDATEANS